MMQEFQVLIFYFNNIKNFFIKKNLYKNSIIVLPIFKGDPNIVYVNPSSPNNFENPKSAILTLPLCNKILANLKSRCMTLFCTKVLNPFKI